MTRIRQKGSHQIREKSKALNQDQAILRDLPEVLDEEIEPFPVEPWEGRVHCDGVMLDPSIIHAHPAKSFEQGCARRIQSLTVDTDRRVGTVETQPEPPGEEARHGCLACAATAAHPAHVIEVGHRMILIPAEVSRQCRGRNQAVGLAVRFLSVGTAWNHKKRGPLPGVSRVRRLSSPGS